PTAYAFQTRCRPSDIRSFMTSYFGATESNTPRTRSALACSSTVLKPKWVSLIEAGSRRSVGMAARRGRRGAAAHRRVAVDAFLGEPLFVLLPQVGLLRAKEVQVVPREDAGVVAVGETRQHRIVADRLERRDLDVALAGLQDLLSRPMPLHFRRR